MTLRPDGVDALIGSRLEAIRRAKRMTRGDLALLSGLPEDNIQSFEDGSVELSACALWTLSCALGVSVDALFETVDART